MISDTTAKSFRQIIAEGWLGAMEERIFRLILAYPRHCDRELAEIAHLKINQVTARRNELVAQGCVEDAGYKDDEETDRTVHIWQIPAIINYRPRPKQPKQRTLKEYTRRVMKR
jgi:hypothetical protein